MKSLDSTDLVTKTSRFRIQKASEFHLLVAYLADSLKFQLT